MHPRRIVRTLSSNASRVVRGTWQRIRRLRILSLGVSVVAVALAISLWSTGRDRTENLRRDSVVVSHDGTRMELDRVPVAFRALYRVEERARGELVVRTQEVWVRRPFDARFEERPDAPPGSDTDTVTVTRFGVFGISPTPGDPVVLQVPPNPPAGDFQPLPALHSALDRGLVELGERRRIVPVDRECQVYRVGGPVAGGNLTPLGERPGERADVCVDNRGLVLEQVTFVDGDRILRRIVAVEVDDRPILDDSMFEPPDIDPAPPEQGGGSVLRVDPASRPPTTFFELPDAPSGFRHYGRFAVIPPQPETFQDPTLATRRSAGVTDVWVRGPDFVAVDQGGTLGRVQPFDPHPHGHPIEAPEFGEGELVLGTRTSQVRFLEGQGRYVRVYGTVEPDRLVEIALALVPVEGGELVYLDPLPGDR